MGELNLDDELLGDQDDRNHGNNPNEWNDSDDRISVQTSYASSRSGSGYFTQRTYNKYQLKIQ